MLSKEALELSANPAWLWSSVAQLSVRARMASWAPGDGVSFTALDGAEARGAAAQQGYFAVEPRDAEARGGVTSRQPLLL